MFEGNKNNFESLINDSLVLVDFFATWCGPCKMLAPVLEEISNDQKNIKIVKIDVDKNEELSNRFGIMSVPTLLLFKDGNLIAKQNGYMPKEELLNWINNN